MRPHIEGTVPKTALSLLDSRLKLWVVLPVLLIAKLWNRAPTVLSLSSFNVQEDLTGLWAVLKLPYSTARWLIMKDIAKNTVESDEEMDRTMGRRSN